MWMFIAGSAVTTLVIVLACVLADRAPSGSQGSSTSSPVLYTSSRQLRHAGLAYQSTTTEATNRRTMRYGETPTSRWFEYTVEGQPGPADVLMLSALARRVSDIPPAGSYRNSLMSEAQQWTALGYSGNANRSHSSGTSRKPTPLPRATSRPDWR
jgi:hypothetical protein